jgi:hypothetical protein
MARITTIHQVTFNRTFDEGAPANFDYRWLQKGLSTRGMGIARHQFHMWVSRLVGMAKGRSFNRFE